MTAWIKEVKRQDGCCDDCGVSACRCSGLISSRSKCGTWTLCGISGNDFDGSYNSGSPSTWIGAGRKWATRTVLVDIQNLAGVCTSCADPPPGSGGQTKFEADFQVGVSCESGFGEFTGGGFLTNVSGAGSSPSCNYDGPVGGGSTTVYQMGNPVNPDNPQFDLEETLTSRIITGLGCVAGTFGVAEGLGEGSEILSDEVFFDDDFDAVTECTRTTCDSPSPAVVCWDGCGYVSPLSPAGCFRFARDTCAWKCTPSNTSPRSINIITQAGQGARLAFGYTGLTPGESYRLTINFEERALTECTACSVVIDPESEPTPTTPVIIEFVAEHWAEAFAWDCADCFVNRWVVRQGLLAALWNAENPLEDPRTVACNPEAIAVPARVGYITCFVSAELTAL